MKEHGFLFKDEMCRAIGRSVDPKTQTRRLVARHNSTVDGKRWPKDEWAKLDFSKAQAVSYGSLIVPNSVTDDLHEVTAIYQPADRIYVKQVWAVLDADFGFTADVGAWLTPGSTVVYREDHHDPVNGDGPDIPKWRTSLHLPKGCARYWLEITEPVRAERACDISEEDAKAEGVTLDTMPATINGEPGTVTPFTYCQAFRFLWSAINGPETFQNWVWRIPFKRVEREARG